MGRGSLESLYRPCLEFLFHTLVLSKQNSLNPLQQKRSIFLFVLIGVGIAIVFACELTIIIMLATQIHELYQKDIIHHVSYTYITWLALTMAVETMVITIWCCYVSYFIVVHVFTHGNERRKDGVTENTQTHDIDVQEKQENNALIIIIVWGLTIENVLECAGSFDSINPKINIYI